MCHDGPVSSDRTDGSGAPRGPLRAFGLVLLVLATLALPSCEAGIDVFYECGPEGACADGLQCYRSEDVTGYCTGTCYGSIECPQNAVCYEGKCILVCEDGGEPCPGGTTCNLVEPPRGICQP